MSRFCAIRSKIERMKHDFQSVKRMLDRDLIHILTSQKSEHEKNADLIRTFENYLARTIACIKLEEFQILFDVRSYLNFTADLSEKFSDIRARIDSMKRDPEQIEQTTVFVEKVTRYAIFQHHMNTIVDKVQHMTQQVETRLQVTLDGHIRSARNMRSENSEI